MTRDVAINQAHFQAMRDLQQIQDALFQDVVGATAQADGIDTPEKRRRYIRNSIAMVEGITAAMRRIALADAEAGVVPFSGGEIAVLRAETYELDDEGLVRSRSSSQKLTRNVRFSFAAVSRIYGLAFSLEVGGNGWRCFRSTVLVRNRLVHPRVPGDLVVTDVEIAETSDAVDWFGNQTRDLFKAVMDSMFPSEGEGQK